MILAPALALALLSSPTPESSPAPERPRAAVLEEVSGVVVGVDRQAHRVEIETPAGRSSFTLDRNTMVYTGRALGTVLDVKPGDRVRIGRNADFRAYWVQVGPGAADGALPARPTEPAADPAKQAPLDTKPRTLSDPGPG